MSNALTNETSPYLRQHAANPVDWQPWGPAALERARNEGKPILLSIGYAACHWCHVMAHESFEDTATAALMNDLYINIKVDREERPDIDRLYQLAQQMLTGRGGGWPLTMFLMPEDQRPFFGGTYFPPDARHGLPAFRDLLTHVAGYFHEHSDELREPAARVVETLNQISNLDPASRQILDATPIARCREQLERSFDGEWGGFGGAPKFPHANFVTRLLHDWQATAGRTEPDLQALYMATLTLVRMAEGGIQDHLGGGFCRYSVDGRWEIPHFEKMLYDNALLLDVYAQAACATGEPMFRDVATGIGDWLLREMRAPEGGFYSSLDADSEGHEGKFYVWQREQLRALLSDAEYAAFAPHFGLDGAANFEGSWHLRLTAGQGTSPIDTAATAQLIAAARNKLLAARVQRVWPGLDDKRLTSWNALTIRALAVAARTLQHTHYADAAADALAFLQREHWRDGRLLATSAGGKARGNAYLDDYAFLADAILELCSVRFDARAIAFGGELLDVLLAQFQDDASGGFWFTSDDHEQLISRSRTFGDDALPSGNAVASYTLQRYGYLLGETRYVAAAERCLRAAWSALVSDSSQHATMLDALEEFLNPPEIVILRGEASTIAAWSRQLARHYAPRRLVFAIPADASGLPPALATKTVRAGETVAYICRGDTCSAPINTLQLLSAELVAAT
jgi:uncharacterized protein YyaL (SSP411 family)